MQSRRQEILIILKQKGEATVDELATILDLTPVTVRHHLDILRADGLVEAPAVRRRHGPGRPQYVYTLTEASADHFPQAYDSLANELLSELKSKLEPDVVQEIFHSIAQQRLEKAPAIDPGLPMDKRVSLLAEHLTSQGFIANSESQNGSWYLYVSNCPFHNVASVHPEVCEVDHYILKKLTGFEVKCHQRITEGAHNCIYELDLSA